MANQLIAGWIWIEYVNYQPLNTDESGVQLCVVVKAIYGLFGLIIKFALCPLIAKTCIILLRKEMAEEDALVVFQGREIRRTLFNDEWWFVAVDIVEALIDSKDPTGYLKDMRRRDEGFKEGWGQIATPLEIATKGGYQRINCVSTKRNENG